MTTTTDSIPVSLDDPSNARILAVSEDKVQGFQTDPFGEIARLSGVEIDTVIQRIAAMLRAGVIRRVRQTLMATNLAKGSLCAWVVPEEKLSATFDWMFQNDPASGHVVIRSTDAAITGSKYRLWTTLKVPQGYSLEKHCRLLCQKTGATDFKLMPAKRLFALGVGHVRRKGMEPGSKSAEPAEVMDTQIVELSELEWRVLTELKREFTPEEIERCLNPVAATPASPDGRIDMRNKRGDAGVAATDERRYQLWRGRAAAAGVALEEFYRVARSLNQRKVIGRFSTFLEHVKPLSTGERVTKFNALFHWAVPAGREIETGREVGRFHIMTHAYWREGGAEFGHVNIMGVAHGTDKDLVLAHKRAIDEHLKNIGIPVSYTNVFWGGRSEIKPSEISPVAYRQWCGEQGVDAETMKE